MTIKPSTSLNFLLTYYRENKRWIWLIIVIVNFMSLLNVGVIVYERLASGLELEIPFYFINEFTGGFTALLLLPFLLFFFTRYPLSRAQVFPPILVYILATVVYGFVFTSLMYLMRVPLYHLASITRLHEIFNDLPYRYLMEYFKQLVDFWLIYAIFWGVNQYKANKNREIQGLHMQQELVKAQLSSLQMQLHPHFFFNTLNAISSIMYTDPARADRIISRLGGFLRTVLQLTDTPSHSLSDEIALTKQFTQIMEERYPDKLTVTYNIPQNLEHFPVPVLLLQPLVENAIQYSVDYTTHTRVGIFVQQEGTDLLVEIRDNGPGIEQGQLSYGMGLTSTLQRLETLYGNQQEVRFDNHKEEGLSVVLQLPAYD